MHVPGLFRAEAAGSEHALGGIEDPLPIELDRVCSQAASPEALDQLRGGAGLPWA